MFKRLDFSKIARLEYLGFVFAVIYILTIKVWDVRLSFNVFRYVFFGIMIVGIIVALVRKDALALILFAAPYLIYVAFNFLFYSDSVSDLSSLFTYIFLPLIFFFFYYLFSKQINVEFCIDFIVFFTSIIGIFAIFESISHTFLLFGNAGSGSTRSRVFADSCLSLACQFAINLLLVYSRRKSYNKVWLIVLLLLNGFALLTTGSRGPLVACVFAFIFIKFIGKKSFGKILFLLFALLAVLLFFQGIDFILAKLDKNSFLYSIAYRLSTITNWETERNNVSRLEKWLYFIDLFKEKPIFGRGIGYCSKTFYLTAESGLIQKLVEIGIVGSILYYACYFSVFVVGLRSLKRNLDSKEKPILISCLAICVCVFIEDCVLQIFESTIVMVLLNFAMAYIVYVHSIVSKRNKKNRRLERYDFWREPQ